MAETSAAAQAETLLPFVESDAAASAADLRAIMDEQGYLFFRRLVPAEAVFAVRRDVLEQCYAAGWLDRSSDLMDGIVAADMTPTSEGQAAYMAVYRKVLKLPSFHNFPCHPALMHIAQVLLGSQVLVHPRRIGRMTFPNNVAATTPPHQDHFYIRGSVDTYSCWTPLGACPVTLGGLAVWPGTHRRGFLDHSVYHPGAVGGSGVPVDPAEATWHTTDFEPGDALFFHAFTIHKALPNLSADRLRLSTDNRYQRDGDSIDPGALLPHFNLT